MFMLTEDDLRHAIDEVHHGASDFWYPRFEKAIREHRALQVVDREATDTPVPEPGTSSIHLTACGDTPDEVHSDLRRQAFETFGQLDGVDVPGQLRLYQRNVTKLTGPGKYYAYATVTGPLLAPQAEPIPRKMAGLIGKYVKRASALATEMDEEDNLAHRAELRRELRAQLSFMNDLWELL